MCSNQSTGIKGEDGAAKYLEHLAYMILHRNFRHSRFEIDIIASKDNTLHFIEVKSLSSSDHVYPEIHVTPKKLNSLKNAASSFLAQHLTYAHVQFDVLSIVMKKDAAPEFFLIEDVYL